LSEGYSLFFLLFQLNLCPPRKFQTLSGIFQKAISETLSLKFQDIVPFLKKLEVVQKLGQAGYNLLLKVSAPLQDPQKLSNKKPD